MKKKFISAILFGALLVASSSAFVSCKDYDDDIDNLRTEITTNATDLKSLVDEKVANLTTEISTLKSQQSALETAYKAADANLQTAIAAAQQAATDAESAAKAYADVQAAAAQKAAIEASQKSLDEAVTKLETAISEANTAIANVDSKYADQVSALLEADTKLQAAIDEANGKIATAQKTADDAAAAATKNAEDLKAVSENLTKVQSELDAQIQLVKTELTQQIASEKAEIEGQIDVINSTLQSNQTALDALQSKDSELAQKIQKNSDDLVALGEQLAQVDTKLAANLASANAYTDSQIALLNASLLQHVEEAQVALEEVQGQISTAYIQIAAANELIDGLTETKADKEELNSAVATLNQSISDNQAAFTAYVASAATQLATIEENIANNTEDISANAENIQRNSLLISNLQSTASTLQDKVAENAANISANTAAITALTTKVTNNENAIKALQEALDGTSTTTGLTERLTELETYVQALNGDAGTIATINSDIAAVDAKVDALVSALNEAFGGGSVSSAKASLTETFTNAISNIKSKLAALDEAVYDLRNRMEQQEEGFTKLSILVNDEIDRLQGHTRLLKSLVFSPTTYYNGIEAIGIYDFQYNPYEVKYAYKNTMTAETADQTDEVPAKILANGEEVVYDVAPLACAQYYLNPSNAIIDTTTAYVKKHFSFLVNNATMTRAISSSNVSVDSARIASAGVLNIYFSIDDISKLSCGHESNYNGTVGSRYNREGQYDDNAIDVAALRYTYSTENTDTVITSDFAALAKYVVNGFNINKVSTEGAVDTEASSVADNHLFETPAEAIADNGNTMRIIIKFDNNTTGVDLDQWINVHYNINGQTDKTWGGQKTIAQHKFQLKYDLLGYVKDGVNESSFATISGSKLTVHKANQTGAKAGKDIVGHHPLIRVTLWDNTKNAIARVGYIVATIDSNDKEYEFASEPNTEVYQIVCADDEAHSQSLTNTEIENLILANADDAAELGITTGTFATTYKPETDANGDIKVYTDKKVVATTLGTVTATTDGIKWALDGEEAYNALVSNTADQVSIYVKYILRDETRTDSPIWVKLIWTPSDKLIAPTAVITTDDKVMADWHAEASDNAGYADVHMQVGSPTSTDEAVFDQLWLNRTFNTSPLDIVKKALTDQGYDKLAASSDLYVHYRFAKTSEQTKSSYDVLQSDGKTYKHYEISVDEDNDGLTMYASYNGTKKLIATITAVEGQITLENNDYATDIINSVLYKDYNKDVEKALTLTIQLNAASCSPADGIDGVTIGLTNETNNDDKFDVRVLKPLYLKDFTSEPMKLNRGTSLIQPVIAEFVDFVGYTPRTFQNVNTTGVDFFEFYGVTSYEIDLDNAKTNYSGTDKAIDPSRFTISFAKPGSDDFTENLLTVNQNEVTEIGNTSTWDRVIGRVKLTQVNMSGANSFYVNIPVVVHTKNLGDLVGTMKINVEKSDGGQED